MTPELATDDSPRQLIQRLSQDLGWLEEYARDAGDEGPAVSRLRLAAALTRNCIGPFLDGAPPAPLHLVVVGGAGAGKSTVTNFLVGTAVAEANPQAGFTRHPIAYTGTNGPLAWPSLPGFLDSLTRLDGDRPGSLDEDVYQVRRLDSNLAGEPVLDRFVVWDCPDMTTWQAGGYVSRLLEVAAAADAIVYVASDERYNDEVPTQFLRLLLQAGKPVATCLTKMRPDQVASLMAHFRNEVVAQIPECTLVTACIAIPHLTTAELTDPAGRGEQYRRPLLDQVAWWAGRPEETRRAAVRGAVAFLRNHQDSLLASARNDIETLQSWNELVDRGRAEFEDRYYREYLATKEFTRFNESLLRLIELLELPGVGQYLSRALWVIRTPYRLVKSAFHRWTQPSKKASIPEEPVLNAALQGWLDRLRIEAAMRKEGNRLWAHVHEGFENRLESQVRSELNRLLPAFEAELAKEVEATARAIYEDLEKNPVALNTLRGVKLTTEVASIGGVLIAGGLNPWDLLIFLVAPLIQEITEFFGKQYVDTQRERTRQRQQILLSKHVTGPLAEFLGRWPASDGSVYEQLQEVLQRVPADTQRLAEEVERRMAETAT